MSDGVDWQPYAEAGLLGAEGSECSERRALLEFLIDQGCGIDEMVEADRRGRLFGLAGDRIVRPGARALTFAQLAERTGHDETLIRRMWRAFGLAGWDSDAGVASIEDAQVLGDLVATVGLVGVEPSLELARAYGAALSRIAEATNSVGRSLSPTGSVATSGSELETARYWAATAPIVASTGRMLDAFYRHHIDLVREHFERSDSWDIMHRGLTRGAVGFVDMSGFTTATELLGEDEFASLMSSFTSKVNETVNDMGGRVVKFVGDAAMVVAPDALTLAVIVGDLVDQWTQVGSGLTLHAGLAQGELRCLDGDYFGSTVNLAARLGALAGSGAIMASASVGQALSEHEAWSVEWFEPQAIRGIPDPVTACQIQRRR